MKSISRSTVCAQYRRAPIVSELAAWAQSVIAAPAAHHATPREARIIRSLLTEIGAVR